MTAIFHHLGAGITVVERGWLNCNQIVLCSETENILIDSGYGRHAAETLRHVKSALPAERNRVDRLINTHCHSDHMGGNAALKAHFDCRITIPVDEVKHVQPWTDQSCWSEMTGQYAAPFDFDDTISPGDTFEAGGLVWCAYSAPGHDMDALMFYAPVAGILITGDALWHSKHGGMGFVWPDIDAVTGRNAFIDAAFETLVQIEKLNPRRIIPGHGAPFDEVQLSIDSLRSRLNAFAANPEKNARHVVKVMLVFALLDREQMNLRDLPAHLAAVPIYREMNEKFLHLTYEALAVRMTAELTAAGAIEISDGVMRPTMKA